MDSPDIEDFYDKLFNEDFNGTNNILSTKNSEFGKNSRYFSLTENNDNKGKNDSKSQGYLRINYNDPEMLDYLMTNGEDRPKSTESQVASASMSSSSGRGTSSSHSEIEDDWSSSIGDLRSDGLQKKEHESQNGDTLSLYDNTRTTNINTETSEINTSTESANSSIFLCEQSSTSSCELSDLSEDDLKRFKHFSRNYTTKTLLILRQTLIQDKASFNFKLQREGENRFQLEQDRELLIDRLSEMANRKENEELIPDILQLQKDFCNL